MMAATAHERSLIAAILDRATSYQWMASTIGYAFCWIDPETQLVVWSPSTLRKPDVCDIKDSPYSAIYKVIAGEVVCLKYARSLPGTGLAYRRMCKESQGITHINTIYLSEGATIEYSQDKTFFLNAIDIVQLIAKDGTVMIIERVTKGNVTDHSTFILDGRKYQGPELFVLESQRVESICRKSLRQWFIRA